MLKRGYVLPPEHLYPPDEWRIVETRYSDEYVSRAETVFALGNGFLGVRGTFEEGRPARSPGTYVNGFHETWPIVHAEEAHGLARVGQTIINVPDSTIFKLYVDDEPLFLATARMQDYRRVLDMQAGTLTREFVWALASGKRVRVRSSRLVSFEHRHLVAMTYEVTVLDHGAPVTISSQVVNRQDSRPVDEIPEQRPSDPRLAKVLPERVLNAQVIEQADGRILLGYRTTNSNMTLAVGVDHVVDADCPFQVEASVDDDGGEILITADAPPGVPIRITKFATYQGSRSIPARELVDRNRRTLDRALRVGFDALVRQQREQLDQFWDRADVRVESRSDQVRRQQAIRWNLFQVAQASWRAENAGISAKGLSGHAYDGHYFWDTEIYVLPFLSYTQPKIAANLLRHRHSMLDRARERAAVMSQKGALFPWRTLTGQEASANFQAGTAQYHINADIAYALRRYSNVQGDLDLIGEVGAEILVETARLWEDLGFYGADGKFHIHGVTGPDEYTTVVNDNTYTNLMARLNLSYAASSVRRLQQEQPDTYIALAHEVGLGPDEVESWERAAAAMHVPYDPERGIHPQDDTFLKREVWDLENTPREKFPLLLHFHPLVIYRYQVIKQADIVLAMFLLGNEFSQEQKQRNYEYYDALTTGDSSLSACVQSILAAEIGNERHALKYFNYALLMDLADIAGNTSDGVHIASSAGVWSSLVFGFGGVRDFDGDLSFEPALPRLWDSLSFSLRFRHRQVRVQLTRDEERYLIDEGEPLEITVRGKQHLLSPGTPLVIRQVPRPRLRQAGARHSEVAEVAEQSA
ncbi:glycoside hydrolase family 65 protein [Micromonospora zhanjiangensis]|uniref:Glycoside hydrolase family 65 protein n=1 Tax=Micromonospora zhanjiangensis TaxID=1522057 RepID=A0ABV8KNZ5_9ACTN